MARPFRYLPPAPTGELIRRARLVARLDDRWTHRLVTVVAGAGFGKTSLLVDAMASGAAAGSPAISPGARHDVWLGCDPDDESAASLLRGLRTSCGLRPQGTLTSLCSWVWSQAPGEICFVLDDIHEVDQRSAGMDLLRQLLVELPLNGHLVAASREPVAIPAARLATLGQLVRLTEADLLFDDIELQQFARARDISRDLCASSGGWPALAELLAHAGEDLVFDYLWEEVLTRVGRRRAECIALFHAVGGGDDDIALVVTGGELSTRQLVAGLSLVARTGHHGAVLHPLWGPPLRDAATAGDLDRARVRAAEVHRTAGRRPRAIELQLDAEAWDEAMVTMREVALDQAFSAAPDEFGRWHRALPAGRRSDPVAWLAAGLDERSRDPVRSSASFAAAAEGFARRGDVDGEIATIAHEGIVRWWANDIEWSGTRRVCSPHSTTSTRTSRRNGCRPCVGCAASPTASAATCLRHTPSSTSSARRAVRTPSRTSSSWRGGAPTGWPGTSIVSARTWGGWPSATVGDLARAAHIDGARLAAALHAARRGDRALVGSLQWPPAGVVRAQLSHRWMLELCAAGIAAGNPPPHDLLERFGPEVREVAARVVDSAIDQQTRSAAISAYAAMPAAPTRPIAIAVLGPLELRLDDVQVDHPHLRRRRVRQLISTLVVRRQVRREVLAAYLWPDHPNPAHNLRVTLGYLQQLLQPDRPAASPAYFVRADGEWLRLVDTDRVRIDLWELEAHLDAGERADRNGDPSQTVEHFAAALRLWRGDPLEDLPDTDWATAERARLVSRYTDAAVRAGELQLAAGRPADASRSAGWAIVADPCSEVAHRLMIRSRLGSGDRSGARRALADCAAALATLDLLPDASTVLLVHDKPG